jgi:hypothetical protein
MDAGATALAALAAAHMRRGEGDVSVEPWITPDGVGVIAHAPQRDDRETPAELAQRVAGAAARTLAGTTLRAETLGLARAAALSHLEQTAGREAAALEAFAGAIAPDHPSWIQPFGPWDRAASGALELARRRWQALAAGPLRSAVLANADATQAAAAAATIDRWVGAAVASGKDPKRCGAEGPVSPRAGRYAVRLPKGTPLAQALVGAPVPQASGAAGRELARLTVAAMENGLLAAALGASQPAIAARASAQLVGGARASALLVDVRAPADQIGEAAARVKDLLTNLPQRVTDADLARAEAALARREREARTSPRRRLISLWSGAPPAAKTSLAAWRGWMTAALIESALVIVEARPE